MLHARAEADPRMDAAQRRARADVERLIAEIKRLRDGRDERTLECHRRIDADKTVATLEGLVARARHRTGVHPLRQRPRADGQRV
ncbi:MAG: hypothetical protein LC790_20345 [Actinobacteria bacterium]|nr:hypothetical protein [Actinomycetota bacterium]